MPALFFIMGEGMPPAVLEPGTSRIARAFGGTSASVASSFALNEKRALFDSSLPLLPDSDRTVLPHAADTAAMHALSTLELAAQRLELSAQGSRIHAFAKLEGIR